MLLNCALKSDLSGKFFVIYILQLKKIYNAIYQKLNYFELLKRRKGRRWRKKRKKGLE